MRNFLMYRKKSKSCLSMTFWLIAFMLVATSVFAQQARTVKGHVADSNGEALIGAAVQVRGTQLGTTTDVDGNFVLQLPDGNNVLEVSYLGYVSQNVQVGNKQLINVTLQQNVTELEETVVIGYGVQKKVHLTGSVAQISNKDLVKVPASNIGQLITGKLPGVMARQSNGAPGSDGVTMLVRGYTSFKGNSLPLVIVDGIERPMDRLDPNDIETISVLKDAAAGAVYGMKAANGVILITTKKGAKGKATVSYNGTMTFSHNTALPKFLNGTQYMQWYNRARELDGLNTPENPYFTDEEIAMTMNGDPTDGYENTNWMEPLDRMAPMHQHNLSVTGGNDNVKYYVSGGYMDQRGFIRDFKMQRGNFRSNVDVKATEDISVTLNVSGRLENSYRPGGISYNNQEYNNVVGVLMYAAPFVPLEYQGLPTSGYRGGSNPLYAAKNSGFADNQKLYLETFAKVEYRLPWVKGLKASMSVGFDLNDGQGKTFNYSYEIMKYYVGEKTYKREWAGGLTENGNMYVGNTRSQQVVLRPTVEYSNTFGKHDVSAMFLYEQTQIKGTELSGSRNGFKLFDIPELNFGDSFPATANGGKSSNSAAAGYVGRLGYAYASKYMADFSFRYDGSYKFAKGNRWGFFPSFSAAYMISEEDFFKNALPNIEKLKIRGSIGLLGRDNVEEFLYRRYYQWQNKNVAFGDTPIAESTLYNGNSYPVKDLTWEKCRTINGGIEMSMWNGLLSAEFDVFYKYTYDILQSKSGIYPPSIGGHFPSIENSGKFDAKGFELVLGHRNAIQDFTYSITGNLSFSRNRILSIAESDNVLPWQSKVGQPLGSILGYKAIGLYQTEEQLKNAPTPPEGSKELRLGDIMYEDLNGDGKIDYRDQTWIGKSIMPEMLFSINAEAQYKGFDFSMQWQGAALCDNMLTGTWDNGHADQTPMTRTFYANDNCPVYLVEDSWTPENPNAEFPRLSTLANGNNGVVSSFWKRNGAYIRLKNITLGYTLPKAWLNGANIQNLRVYVAAVNLLTFNEFKYLDPEAPNVLQGYYPQQKTVSVGLNVSF